MATSHRNSLAYIKKNRERICWGFLLVFALIFVILRLPGLLTKVIISRGADGATCIFSQDVVGFESPMAFFVFQNGQNLFVEDAENDFRGFPVAYWSKNKRLVVIENNGWITLAYDFTRQELINRDSREIKARLKQNGGDGEMIFAYDADFDQESHHPWAWEMKYIKR